MMISRLKMSNFKNFKDETLHVGPFTVIAGANGSGKSNVRKCQCFHFSPFVRKRSKLGSPICGSSLDK